MSFEIGALHASASMDTTAFETGVRKGRAALKQLSNGFEVTTRDVVRNTEQMTQAHNDTLSKVEVAAQRQINALLGVGRASSASARKWAQDLDQQARAFDTLKSSVDPLFAASKQYERAVQDVEKAVQSGVVAQQEGARVLDLAAERYLGLESAAQRAANAQKAADQASQQAKAGYESLRASVDPLFAMSKQYERALKSLDAAQKAGVITDKDRARTLQLLEDQMQGVNGAAGVAGGGVSKFGQVANQVGYQIQDVFVSGPLIGWFRAISQQAPQAAGAFAMLGGPLGTIVPWLGTAVAVGGALIPTFFNIGKEAATFEDRLNDLSQAVSAYQRYADLASGSTSELEQRFGSASGHAKEVAEFLQELSSIEALEKMEAAAAGVSEEFRIVSDVLKRIDIARLQNLPGGEQARSLRVEIEKLADAYKLTEPEARALLRAVEDFDKAETGKEALAAAVAMNDVFVATYGTLSEVPTVLRPIAKEVGLIAHSAGEVLSIEQQGAIEIKRRVAAGSDLVANFKAQAAMAKAVSQYGADSAQVEALKRVEAFKAAEALIQQESLSGLVARQVRDSALAAHDAEVNAARAAVALREGEVAARALASAMASAAGFTSSLQDQVHILDVQIAAAANKQDVALAGQIAGYKLRAQAEREASIEAARGNTQAIAAANEQFASQTDLIDAIRAGRVELGGLTKANKESARAASKASKSALSGLETEITQRRKLVSLTGDERKRYEALIDVQRRLGREAGKVSAARQQQLADQLIAIERIQEAQEEAERQTEEIAGRLAEAVFDPSDVGDFAKDWLREAAIQFAKQQIFVPIVGQYVGTQGGPNPISLGGGGVGGGSGGGGGFNPLGIGRSFIGSFGTNVFGGGTFAAGSGLLGGLGASLNAGFGAGGSLAGLFAAGSNAALAGGGLAASIGAVVPHIAAVAAVVAGFKKLFGRKFKYSGIEGAFGTGGFDGQAFDFFKGGLFRSDKTEYRELDAELDSALDQQFNAISDGIRAMAGNLNLGVEALDNFTGATIKIKTTGKTQEEIQQLLTDAMTDASNDMVDLIANFDRFARVGEESIDTLNRLATSLTSANDGLDLIGRRGFHASLQGGDRASHLIDQFGGAQNFGTAISGYWGAFYSEAERNETFARRLQEQFEALNVTMPSTREEFRALVDAQRLGTVEGREMFASLMNLAGGFNQLQAVVDQQQQEELALQQQIWRLRGDENRIRQAELDLLRPGARALQEQVWAYEDLQGAMSGLNTSISNMIGELEGRLGSVEDRLRLRYNRLQVSVDAERDALTGAHDQILDRLSGRLDTLSAAAEVSNQLFQTLDQAVRDRRRIDTPGQDFERRRALMYVQNGGSDPDRLSNALSVLGEDNSSRFSTYADYLTDYYSTSNIIANRAGDAQAAMSADERAVEALQSQISILESQHQAELERLDQILEAGRLTYETALGQHITAIGVDHAVAQLNQTADRHALVSERIEMRTAELETIRTSMADLVAATLGDQGLPGINQGVLNVVGAVNSLGGDINSLAAGIAASAAAQAEANRVAQRRLIEPPAAVRTGSVFVNRAAELGAQGQSEVVKEVRKLREEITGHLGPMSQATGASQRSLRRMELDGIPTKKEAS
ncbi:hypothetical protein [Epibacterium ulvae]|uniref:hypothetical protein n=1 Tax=Epibacterium ulvae TaxID=1156985 RepID=UPI002490E428|nr:hypothetical protein [Epibacterium ulvae]